MIRLDPVAPLSLRMSDHAAEITGVNLAVDGGPTAYAYPVRPR